MHEGIGLIRERTRLGSGKRISRIRGNRNQDTTG
jgi:hypothetical protein